MRLIGMSTGSALPDCSPARIGPCDSLWMFLVTTTTRMILKSWKMHMPPPQVVGQPVILGPGLTIKRGDCQARSAEDLVNPAIRNLFEEDPRIISARSRQTSFTTIQSGDSGMRRT